MPLLNNGKFSSKILHHELSIIKLDLINQSQLEKAPNHIKICSLCYVPSLPFLLILCPSLLKFSSTPLVSYSSIPSKIVITNYLFSQNNNDVWPDFSMSLQNLSNLKFGLEENTILAFEFQKTHKTWIQFHI